MRHRIKFNPRRNNSATIARIMRAIKSPQSRRLIYKREHEDIVFTRLKGPNFSYKVPLRMPRMCRRPYEWAFGQYRWSLS